MLADRRSFSKQPGPPRRKRGRSSSSLPRADETPNHGSKPEALLPWPSRAKAPSCWLRRSGRHCCSPAAKQVHGAVTSTLSSLVPDGSDGPDACCAMWKEGCSADAAHRRNGCKPRAFGRRSSGRLRGRCSCSGDRFVQHARDGRRGEAALWLCSVRVRLSATPAEARGQE